jgi:hypothetical protein
VATKTQLATAGLQGWRAKVGDTVAPPVANRTPASEEQVRAIVGALFFALSVFYVTKTIVTIARRAQGR